MVELLVATSVMLIVAAAVMVLMLIAFRQTDNQNDRVVALDDARNGLLAMQNEIRSASGLNSVSPQVLDVLVQFPGDTADPYHWIRFKCVGNDKGSSQGVGGKCTRQDKTLNSGSDCAIDGSGPGCVVILRDVVKYGDSHDRWRVCFRRCRSGGCDGIAAAEWGRQSGGSYDVEGAKTRVKELAMASAR